MSDIVPGRTDVAARALERTVAATSARHLRVPLRDVHVTLTDAAGLLAISVVAPLRLPPLSGASAVRLMKRGDDARSDIRVDVEAQTGRTVGPIALRLTRALVLHEKRVK
ncbi:hypothetical protein [Lacisediminihabitans changchengi]|uniref:Uncharacterized protein n=1 Tax=Lacisediminihabitans changchengi TaxID=2787634 RepID=A0A934SNE7_9MICO|nr:hypothetical protein [Lacisediminihabitans changchengi]MBK4348207.1 hypothetical protein [Lacisediminihabitans changchengi]